MASEAPATGSPRQRSPTRSPTRSPSRSPAGSPQTSPRQPAASPRQATVPPPPPPPPPPLQQQQQPQPQHDHPDPARDPAVHKVPSGNAPPAPPPLTIGVSSTPRDEKWLAKPLERQLIKREVVRVEAAWLKRKKGNPNLNPRGFQVICTLTGGVQDPATAAKKANLPKPPFIKDQREPPPKSIAVDVKEYPDAYMFVADVPGLRNTDIKIDVVNDRFMTISCGRSRSDEQGVYYISLERTMGKFSRKFLLPANSNLEAMKAGCQDGVLTIFVPIAPPEAEQAVRPSVDVAWDRRKSRS